MIKEEKPQQHKKELKIEAVKLVQTSGKSMSQVAQNLAGFHGILNTFCATRMQQVNRISHHDNARASRPRIRVNIPCG
jgi:hypothetical protein